MMRFCISVISQTPPILYPSYNIPLLGISQVIKHVLHVTIVETFTLFNYCAICWRFNMIDIFSIMFNHTNVIINIILIGAFILNLIFAFTIIFMERRSAGSIWAWLLVLVLIPILGFIIYLFIGRQIQRDHIFSLNDEDKIGIEMIVNEQLEALKMMIFQKAIIKL